MDYILKSLDRKLSYYEAANKVRDQSELFRIKIEYGLIFLMSYLWGKYYEAQDADTKEYIFEKARQPSIGSILDIARKLDKDKVVFNNKRLNDVVNNYPKLRNERIGHGYVFEDNAESHAANLKSISSQIYSSCQQLQINYDLIAVLDFSNGNFTGINYKSDGATFLPWACPERISKFEVGGIYALDTQNTIYHKLSPFIYLTPEEEFFIFKDIEEVLTGKVRYNQLLRTGNIAREWEELSNMSLENSDFRRKSVNGTIVSIINKNYKRYIEIGVVKQKIVKFLQKDRASVCATVWGHGGVGKTATVQSICEDLANEKQKRFDYIIFISAKDRYYNYYTGAIEIIQENVNTFEGLIRSANRVMFNDESSDPERIINTENKVLLVVDDYETFPSEEKQKVENFIRNLDINHHKVLVTTRANLIIGDEFQTNELDEKETKSFLLEVLRSEFDHHVLGKFETDLALNDKYKIVHNITSGRPLFVYQFAYIWMQVGSIEEALSRKIKQEKTAIEFLYGRIYDYLSPVAKDIFVAMGQIVTDDDPTNLIEKARYILNLENSDKFENGIRELEKLRIIEIIESRFFKVYSREILHIMSIYFDRRTDSFRRSTISRIQEVTKDKKLDNERALLYNANTARISRNEEEVIRLYRSILNRETSPFEVKTQSILNLTDYLFNNRGKRDEAIKVFRDYEHLFPLEPTVARMHSMYCWATGRQMDSIQILLDLVVKKPKQVMEDRNTRIEILGLLLMYRAIDAIQERESLKEKRRYGEIDPDKYMTEYDKTKSLFREICEKNGKVLLNELQKIQDLSALSSGARQNSITGLYQYVNLNIRLRRFRDGIRICEFVLDKFPTHFHDQFKGKLSFCRRDLSDR